MTTDSDLTPAVAPRRSFISGLFATVVCGSAVWLSTIPDAWPRFLHHARTAGLWAAAIGGTTAVGWVVIRVVRGDRTVRWTLAVLAPASVVGAVWVVWGTPGLITVGVCLVCAAAMFWGPRLRRAKTTERVNPAGDEGWRNRIGDEWPATAVAAALTHPDVPGEYAPLAGPVEPHGPAAVTLTLDLDPVLLEPADVQAAVPVLRRRLRADHVRVQPAGVDTAYVRAYRRHPMDVYVPWSDLGRVDDPSGEWVPFGVTESGGPAVLRWRLSTVLFGQPETGKTMIIRAFLRGLIVQGVPHRLWLYDNRADYRGLRPIAHRYATSPAEGMRLITEFASAMDTRIASHPGLDEGHQLVPSHATPAEILIVGELQSALSHRGTGDMRRHLTRVPREGRAVSHVLLSPAQTSLKEEIGPVRDYFPQRVACRFLDDSLVDPALGDGALAAGGDAHLIPANLPGVAVMLDPATRWPLLLRGADVPPQDTRVALVDPYRKLMGRHLTVIDGQTG